MTALRTARRLLVVAAMALPALGAAPASSGDGGGWCNVGVRVTQLDARRVALALWTPAAPGRASGVATLFTGGRSFAVTFHDVAVSAEPAPQLSAEPPLVVQLPFAAQIGAAVVSSLDGAGECRPYFAPWPDPQVTTPAQLDEFRDRASRSSNVVTASDGGPFAANRCDKPAALASMIAYKTAMVQRPEDNHMHSGGNTRVLLIIDQSGHVVDEHVLASNGYANDEALALDSARRSVWAPARFNCEPVASERVFTLRD